MKIEAGDVLVFAGMAMSDIGTWHFSPWAALILSGIYFMVVGYAIEKVRRLQRLEQRGQ
jgi:hypothetical protein